MSELRLADEKARARALAADTSFIVQAPAGSGKTGLLIQRFLALLGRVDKPEEIIAITFTRKAAAEMRTRILEALHDAANDAPEETYLRETWELARAAVARDEEFGWGLTLNPARLRLMTIDALCGSLVRQMPTLSAFGASPGIAERPQRLYQRAARRLLAQLETEDAATASLQTVLAHLDNDMRRTERLLMQMLAVRDHWLPHVGGGRRQELARPALEAALAACSTSALEEVSAALPPALADEIVELAAYAATHSPADSPLRALAGIDALPDAQIQKLPMWLGIRQILLTAGGALRSRVTAAEGFPAPSTSKDPEEKERRLVFKERVAATIEGVRGTPGLVESLKLLDILPPTRYAHEDWQMLDALKRLLPRAVAELALVFQERGAVDYTEVAHRALAALGDDEQPTDLALQLDYRIRHLLVDEFQDTSRTQFDLLSRLIAGWEPDDGRTLFLVGDPMQSIYRFREADVGLFLHARQHGVGAVALEPLRLEANFRSRPALVEFCNAAFSQIFPPFESIEDSAVTFAPSQAARDNAHDSAVHLHAYTAGDPRHEAAQVVEIVRAARATPGRSVAVLVRSRTHFASILPALRAAHIGYRAVELERLNEQSVVSDLWALTRALLHLADRTAWLTVLRAPWCGLTLADLYALCAGNHDLTVWELTINASRREELSRDGALRLARVKRVLADSLAERGRRDLRRWVEGTWTALGGPACVHSATEMDNALAFLGLLERFEDDGGFDDLAALAEAVDDLYARPDPNADESVQVMTMHKAKGLEFDVVVIPALHRGTRSSERSLLTWQEQTDNDGQPRLLLAPIQATGDVDPIGRFIAAVDRRRDRLEQVRLLYVSATRAREALHLLGQVRLADDGGVVPPSNASLLTRLWPALGERFAAQVVDTGATVADAAATRVLLRRVPSEWMLPQAPQPKPWRSTESVHPDSRSRGASFAGDTARHVGTVVHRVLQQVAEEGVDSWIGHWMDGLDHYLSRMLIALGAAPKELEQAVTRAHSAIRSCLLDDRGRWLLLGHRDARSELPLTGWLEGRLYNVVLDRTFVDDDGIRWIVDYKTSSHHGGTVEAFIDAEFDIYRSQLELYGRLMQRFDPTPVQLGLYFPLVQGWREWRFTNPS